MSKESIRPMKSGAIRKLVITGMLAAVTIVLGLTPLGLIPIGPLNLTILHLPVVLGAMLEGPIVGTVLGLAMGGASLYKAFTTPTVLSPLFLNPLVSIVPRMMIGPVAWLAYTGLKRLVRGRNSNAQEGQTKSTLRSIASAAPAAVGAFVGTMTNTVLVMGSIHLLYADEFAQMLGQPISMAATLIWGMALANFLPEAIAAAVILTPTERALSHVVNRQMRKRKK